MKQQHEFEHGLELYNESKLNCFYDLIQLLYHKRHQLKVILKHILIKLETILFQTGNILSYKWLHNRMRQQWQYNCKTASTFAQLSVVCLLLQQQAIEWSRLDMANVCMTRKQWYSSGMAQQYSQYCNKLSTATVTVTATAANTSNKNTILPPTTFYSNSNNKLKKGLSQSATTTNTTTIAHSDLSSASSSLLSASDYELPEESSVVIYYGDGHYEAYLSDQAQGLPCMWGATTQYSPPSMRGVVLLCIVRAVRILMCGGSNNNSNNNNNNEDHVDSFAPFAQVDLYIIEPLPFIANTTTTTTPSTSNTVHTVHTAPAKATETNNEEIGLIDYHLKPVFVSNSITSSNTTTATTTAAASACIEYEREGKLYRIINRLVNILISLPDSTPFHYQVSRVEHPNYHAIVTTPIAMNDICKKAQRGEYDSINSLKKDMLLLRNNCYLYCQDLYPDLVICADALLEEFEALCDLFVTQELMSIVSTTTTATADSNNNSNNNNDKENEYMKTRKTQIASYMKTLQQQNMNALRQSPVGTALKGIQPPVGTALKGIQPPVGTTTHPSIGSSMTVCIRLGAMNTNTTSTATNMNTTANTVNTKSNSSVSKKNQQDDNSKYNTTTTITTNTSANINSTFTQMTSQSNYLVNFQKYLSTLPSAGSVYAYQKVTVNDSNTTLNNNNKMKAVNKSNADKTNENTLYVSTNNY